MLSLLNKRFGKLLVIKELKISNRYGRLWLCKCDCGNQIARNAGFLNSGGNTSCGCDNHKFKPIHGGYNTRIYSIWNGMRFRCYNKISEAYENYGGRGITMCKEWLEDFLVFKEWALNNNYSDKLSIERIDVNGNYCPENCKWIPLKEQSRNKRNNIWITLNGVTKIMKEWALEKGLCHKRVSARLKAGWTPEEALEVIPKLNKYCGIKK